jgi:hypothetical protein
MKVHIMKFSFVPSNLIRVQYLYLVVKTPFVKRELINLGV